MILEIKFQRGTDILETIPHQYPDYFDHHQQVMSIPVSIYLKSIYQAAESNSLLQVHEEHACIVFMMIQIPCKSNVSDHLLPTRLQAILHPCF